MNKLNKYYFCSLNKIINKKLKDTIVEFPFKNINSKINLLDEWNINKNEKMMLQYFVEQKFNLIIDEKEFSVAKNISDISKIIENKYNN